MEDKSDISKNNLSAEWFLRGVLTRLGDQLDRLTRRKEITPSSLATSRLIERLQRLLDSEVTEVPGKGMVVPHIIRLKIQWDKFSTGENDTLERLQKELLAAAVDHINNSLYYTLQPLDLKVSPDYFTEGIKLLVSFDEFPESVEEKEINITLPNVQVPDSILNGSQTMGNVPAVLYYCKEPKGKAERLALEIPSDGRISVGRSGGNHLTLDDSSVSNFHASLSLDPGEGMSVADTGSTNGTFINGQRIAYGKATKLRPSDVVKFGTIEVMFELRPRTPETSNLDSENSSTGETLAIGGSEITSLEDEASAKNDPNRNS